MTTAPRTSRNFFLRVHTFHELNSLEKAEERIHPKLADYLGIFLAEISALEMF